MTVRTKQLALVASSSTSQQVMYTCPSGHRTIVKDFELRSAATAPGAMAVRVTKTGLANDALLFRIAAGVQNEAYRVSGLFVVLEAGDHLDVSVASATGGGWAFLASGAELVL